MVKRRRAPRGLAALFACVPSMMDGLGVEVPRGAGRSDPREPQGDVREGVAERSGERNRGPTNRNRIGGDAEQGKRARNREALTTKAQAA